MTCDGGGEIEAGAAGFERQDKKGRATVALKGIHQLLAFADRRAAMKNQAGLAKDRRQMPRQRVGDFAVLGEDQDFLLLGGDFLAQFTQAMEFAAVRWRIGPIAEPLGRMVADLFEAGKESQNDATALDAFDFRRHQAVRPVR